MKTRLAFALALALVLAVPALSQGHDEQQPDRGHGGQPPRGEAQHPSQQQHTGPQSGEIHRPAQPQQNQPRANQGYIPPPPPQRPRGTKPETERWGGGRVNSTPHVNNNRWYGRDKPNDKRYRLDHPFAHGHFARFGPSYRYNIARIDLNLHRFWLPGGYYFEVSPWDWSLAANWCWTCGGDDFVIYEDPDHPGWYLLYNLYTGVFVHVLFMGM
jgi:hypothetical protein